jgi:chromosome partitioning protein
MKIISVVNQKGGCGKTVTAVNLAAALSREGYRTLLIDLDPQAHATFALRKESNFTITDMLEKIYNDQDYNPHEVFLNVDENFYFVPSRIGLSTLEHKLNQREDKLDILSKFISKIETGLDYLLIDCPPNLGLLTLNALAASDYALIPVNICDFSLKGVEIIKEILVMLKEFKGKAPAPFYLLSNVDTRSNFSKVFITKLKNQAGDQLLKNIIRSNVHFREAATKGVTIYGHPNDARGTLDFSLLAQEIAKITSNSAQWTPLFYKGVASGDIYVAGDFNNWQKEERFKLKKIGEELWSINVPLAKGKYRYKFLAGGSWICDPHNRLAEDDSFGGKNSLLIVE